MAKMKAYAVTGDTKKGRYASWRYDALCGSADCARAEALAKWKNDNPACDCHLFHVTVKRIDDFPVCLGRWFKTGESLGGKWVSYDLPTYDD